MSLEIYAIVYGFIMGCIIRTSMGVIMAWCEVLFIDDIVKEFPHSNRYVGKHGYKHRYNGYDTRLKYIWNAYISSGKHVFICGLVGALISVVFFKEIWL